MIETVSYDDTLSVSSIDGRSLLLGNGFSQAYDRDIFAYKRLLDKADLGEHTDAIRSVFASLRTADFEAVIHALERLARLIPFFATGPSGAAAATRARQAAARCRDALGQTISDLHPDRSTRVTDEGYATTREFIEQYETIFTVNYDLLLYWVFMRGAWYKQHRHSDGFWPTGPRSVLTWKKQYAESLPTQNIFFLHGALHYVQTDDGLVKLRWRSLSNTSILEQVRERMDKGEYPLLVAEGTARQKLRAISRSPYLLYAFERFKSLKGHLVVFGVNFNGSDSHLLRAIEASDVDRLSVSLYGNSKSKRNNRIKGLLLEVAENRTRIDDKRPLTVEVFDASQVSLWETGSTSNAA